MKFSILALGAAVAGITSQCVAQIQIESTAVRNPQTRLVSQNQDFFGSSSDQTIEEPSASNESDYFAESTEQAEISDQSEVELVPRSVVEKPSLDDSPKSGKPITTGNNQAPLHVLSVTPEVGMVPVCWQNTSGCVTPNPVADYMMMNWCTNGLWDTYPCYRARQCAHIQKHIHGYNRYTGTCSSCATGSCGSASSCASGNCGPAVTACAQNQPAANGASLLSSANSLAANVPSATSPFVGELQAGLPIVDLSQLPAGPMQTTSYGAPGRSTLPVLPSGQAVLQLPADVPTVPAGAAPVKPSTSLQVPNSGVLPSVPLPTATPVVASRPAAPLR